MTGKNIDGFFGELFLKSEGIDVDNLELCETYFETDRIRVDYKEKGERTQSKYVSKEKAYNLFAFYILKHESHEAN